jgi:hypothetical protein
VVSQKEELMLPSAKSNLYSALVELASLSVPQISIRDYASVLGEIKCLLTCF